MRVPWLGILFFPPKNILDTSLQCESASENRVRKISMIYSAMRMSSMTVSHKNTIRNLLRFLDEKVSYARAIFK